eukprot:6483832-Amphidinium_carterae.1
MSLPWVSCIARTSQIDNNERRVAIFALNLQLSVENRALAFHVTIRGRGALKDSNHASSVPEFLTPITGLPARALHAARGPAHVLPLKLIKRRLEREAVGPADILNESTTALEACQFAVDVHRSTAITNAHPGRLQ